MENKLLLEYPWLPKVFEMSKEHGLDWLRMASMALILSGGDPRRREIDWDFLDAKLGPDNPKHTLDYGAGETPSIDIIDRATRWGLFQIHGQAAIDLGAFTGRLINFIDIGANTRAACTIMASLLKDGMTVEEAERYFGVDSSLVDEQVDGLKQSISMLLRVGEDAQEEED